LERSATKKEFIDMKNGSKINLTGLTFMLLVASPFCSAHPEYPKKISGTLDDKFEKADTNSDGLISKDEFLNLQRRRIEKRFTKIDLDKDNHLSLEEMKKSFKHANPRPERK